MQKIQVFTFLFMIGLVLAFSSSCVRDYIEYEAIDSSYFPLQTGKYAVYAVDSILYNDFEETVDTSSFLLREEIGEIEYDNLGKPYYRINRYIKADTFGAPWVFDAVWAAQKVDQFAYRIEDNLRYINLVFPLTLNKNWDGIVYIRRDTTISIPGGSIDIYKDWDDFQVVGMDESATIAGVNYDSVVTVLRVDKINNIERRYSIEKYAKNIGLISRKDSILDTQCGGNITPQCIAESWATKAEKGFIIQQELVETNW